MAPVRGQRGHAPAWLGDSGGSGTQGGPLGACRGAQRGAGRRACPGPRLGNCSRESGGHGSVLPPPSPRSSVGVPAPEQTMGMESRLAPSTRHRLWGQGPRARKQARSSCCSFRDGSSPPTLPGALPPALPSRSVQVCALEPGIPTRQRCLE